MTAPATPVVELRGVTKAYAGGVSALRGADLTICRGELVAVVGPSGSGKSTLLNLIGTLDRPTSGDVRLDGEDPFVLDEPKLAEFRSRRIGFIFQDHHLLPQCSVLESFRPSLVSSTTRAPIAVCCASLVCSSNAIHALPVAC